jgi:ubiquinone/menaquinone biosynthesis C-methylase UbiE
MVASMKSLGMQDVIRKGYNEPGIAESYAKNTKLLRAEEFIFSYLKREIDDKAVLDIGVGTGRTVPYLRAHTQNYTGIDFSESMLRLCKEKYGKANLLLCDARNMVAFADGVFDVVFSCFNAIDDADHKDRGRILGEVHRVLKKHGVFVFSSHNLDSVRRSAYKFRGFVTAQNPVQLVKQNAVRVKRYFTGILNHLRNKRNEVEEKNYSIINDPSHNFSLLTYYIKKENQVSQLEEAGFSEIEMVDEYGSLITIDQDCRDAWIYYICRKVG